MAREVHVISRPIISRPIVVLNTVGRIASRVRNVLTIAVAEDTLRIHVGMLLRAGIAPDQLRCGALEVVATNEENGTVTVADPTAVTCLCDDDWLYWSASGHR